MKSVLASRFILTITIFVLSACDGKPSNVNFTGTVMQLLPTVASTQTNTSLPSNTTTSSQTVLPRSTTTPTPTQTTYPTILAEVQTKLNLFMLRAIDGWVFDNQGVRLGELVEGELVLNDEILVEHQGVFLDQVEGFSAVEISPWDRLALHYLDITPVSFEGTASMSDGQTVYLPMPKGSEFVENNPGVVRLTDGVLRINRFNQPKDSTIYYGIDNITDNAVALVKNENGEFGQPNPIDFEAGSVVLVKQDSEGQTVIIVGRERDQNADVYGLVDYQRVVRNDAQILSQFIKANGYQNEDDLDVDIIDRLGETNLTLFVSQDLREGDREPLSNILFTSQGLIVGWLETIDEQLGKILVQLVIRNPLIEGLIYGTIGYRNSDGKISLICPVSIVKEDGKGHIYPLPEINESTINGYVGQTVNIMVSVYNIDGPTDLSKIGEVLSIATGNMPEYLGLPLDEIATMYEKDNGYQLLSNLDVLKLVKRGNPTESMRDIEVFREKLGESAFLVNTIRFLGK
ncbi:MAG: hypothetical protein H8D23_08630 [Candidatus Brocadiales bacterium]|nr:hypothetical protein [Candidatus Brocadiales bacterium]